MDAKNDKHQPGRLVGLAQMVESIKGKKKDDIGKKLKQLTKKKLVQPPLEPHQRDLIERRVNYSQATKDVTKWDPIVKQRRKEKQLKFPLNEEPISLISPRDVLAEQRKPTTDLEKATHEILKHSEDVLTDNKEFTKAEEKFLQAISLEEAKARHIELQKMRSLVSHYGAKMKRQKKIKSKSYHRRLKHERRRIEAKKIDSGEKVLSEIEKLERLRVQERATLKHKKSKWSKHAKILSKFDKNARQAIMDQHALAAKNMARPRKRQGSDDDDDDDDDSSSVDSDNVVSGPAKPGEEEDDDITEINGNQNSRVEDEDDDDDDEVIDVSDSDDDDNNNNNNNTASSDTKRPTVVDNREPKKNLDSKELNDFDPAMELDDSGDEADNEQRKLMSEAFAEDDVVKEFDATKQKLADEEQPKDLDLYLPGWNDWVGPGIKINRRKKEKFLIKAKKIKRRDDTLGNVIISEKADGNIKQYMVKKLPYPLKSEAKLQEKLSEPVSASFRDQLTFREVTQPKVITRMGTKIEPMHKSELKGGRSSKLDFKK